MSSQPIGVITGYFKEQRSEREEWLAEKEELVASLTRKARAAKVLSSLDAIANEARAKGIWHAGEPPLKVVIGQCNSRMRGYDGPVIYGKEKVKVLVINNQAQAEGGLDVPRLCQRGYHYMGKA
jgi:hypothetical protein